MSGAAAQPPVSVPVRYAQLRAESRLRARQLVLICVVLSGLGFALRPAPADTPAFVIAVGIFIGVVLNSLTLTALWTLRRWLWILVLVLSLLGQIGLTLIAATNGSASAWFGALAGSVELGLLLSPTMRTGISAREFDPSR